MFPAFQSTITVSREYVDDLGPMRFPWVNVGWATLGNWPDLRYAIAPVVPLFWLWYRVGWWNHIFRTSVAWRWFKCYKDRRGAWKPYGFKPADECIPEGACPYWRDLATYLWRRTKRVVIRTE